MILVVPLLDVMGLASSLARKSSMLSVLSITAVAVAAYVTSVLLCLRRGLLWLLCMAPPPLSLAALWLLLGQPLGSLASFLDGVVELASGYTDAMSLGDPRGGLPAYLLLGIAGLVMCAAVTQIRGIRPGASLLLAIVGAVTVATAMKQGFVRADQHVLIAFSALVGLGAVSIGVSSQLRRTGALAELLAVLLVASIGFGPGALAIILPVHQVSGIASVWPSRQTGDCIASVTVGSVQGGCRIGGCGLHLPTLDDKVDTYSHKQAAVLARSLGWSPGRCSRATRRTRRGWQGATVSTSRGQRLPSGCSLRRSRSMTATRMSKTVRPGSR